ncbi:MAG: 4-hydroxy-tetrahydrodipicolinate reductase [Bacteroides sp.]|nr:MAG: 4-hydroxy-tetrahydrodipicolinate reductase [Bacteroides sp.]
MKIALLGYGKMGHYIENVLMNKNHTIVLKSNTKNVLKNEHYKLKQVNLAIDFSHPDIVVENILTCFDYDVPIVVGTTGWNQKIDFIKNQCLKLNQSILYSPNFSLGCNILIYINDILSKIFNNHIEYDISITEGHNKNKYDSPSGTSIKIANDIINNIARKQEWVNQKDLVSNRKQILINSIRNNKYTGYHSINYKSSNDIMILEHSVFSRKSFAEGAVICGEWLIGKSGFFTINDIIELYFNLK